MTVTIPRNHRRRIADVKARSLVCHVYRLDNDFHAEQVDPAYAWDMLDRYRSARLTVDEINGSPAWTIRVHSNLWYELRESPDAPASQADHTFRMGQTVMHVQWGDGDAPVPGFVVTTTTAPTPRVLVQWPNVTRWEDPRDLVVWTKPQDAS